PRRVPRSSLSISFSSLLPPPATSTLFPYRRSSDLSTILKTSSRIENLKNSSISTYKCTKQLMFEKLGESSRTVDAGEPPGAYTPDRKSTRLNSSHVPSSYAVFCMQHKDTHKPQQHT